MRSSSKIKRFNIITSLFFYLVNKTVQQKGSLRNLETKKNIYIVLKVVCFFTNVTQTTLSLQEGIFLQFNISFDLSIFTIVIQLTFS